MPKPENKIFIVEIVEHILLYNGPDMEPDEDSCTYTEWFICADKDELEKLIDKKYGGLDNGSTTYTILREIPADKIREIQESPMWDKYKMTRPSWSNIAIAICNYEAGSTIPFYDELIVNELLEGAYFAN